MKPSARRATFGPEWYERRLARAGRRLAHRRDYERRGDDFVTAVMDLWAARYARERRRKP